MFRPKKWFDLRPVPLTTPPTVSKSAPRACRTCGYVSVHEDEAVVGKCVPGYHTLALVVDDPDPDSRAMHEELDRREWAFESAVAEMSMPRFTTEQILERYLTVVAS